MNRLSRIHSRGRRALGAALAAGVLIAGASHAHDASQAATANPSAQVYASPSQISMVQERLREQGHKPGAAGTWDDRTIAAVRAYQQEHDLASSGQLDTSLLSALKIGDVLAGETSAGFLDGLLSAEQSDGAAGANTRGAPIYVSPVHVAQIQHLLREQGHYTGKIDGAWGPETARAANKFRAALGLEAADGLDIALLRALNNKGSAVPKLAAATTARSEGVPLHAGPAAVRALQRELAQKGHEAGAVDGMWGENTRQALRSFQQEHGLETTGTLTLPTLAALGIDVAGKTKQGDFSAHTRDDGITPTEDKPDAVATTERQD